ncbi:hypothetical protein AAHC03_010011 [Spirometra sp. Aus1]
MDSKLSFGSILIADRDRVSDDEVESSASTLTDDQRSNETSESDSQWGDEFADCADEEERLYIRDVGAIPRERDLTNTGPMKIAPLKSTKNSCSAGGSIPKSASGDGLTSTNGGGPTDISSTPSISRKAAVTQRLDVPAEDSVDKVASSPTGCPFGMMLENAAEGTEQRANKEAMQFFNRISKKLLDVQRETRNHEASRKSVRFASSNATISDNSNEQLSASTTATVTPEVVTDEENSEPHPAEPAVYFQDRKVVVDEANRRRIWSSKNSEKITKLHQQPVHACEPVDETSAPLVVVTTAFENERAQVANTKVEGVVAGENSKIESKNLLALPSPKKVIRRSTTSPRTKKVDQQLEKRQPKTQKLRKITEKEIRSDPDIQQDTAKRQLGPDDPPAVETADSRSYQNYFDSASFHAVEEVLTEAITSTAIIRPRDPIRYLAMRLRIHAVLRSTR